MSFGETLVRQGNLSTPFWDGLASPHAAKRLADVIVSALGLIACAPLLVAIAVLIKLESRGPVIFRQERHGFRNTRFFMLKFRTMKHASAVDPQVTQATRADPRTTFIGSWLRRLSLDELPQLINVLRGDMSIVGPRPHAVPHNERYAVLIDNYLARHNVKPGLTGWAQVNGERGQTETTEAMQRRLDCDLYYIANWSLRFDFKIFVMTFPAVMRGHNAY